MIFKYTWLILRKSLNIFELYLSSKNPCFHCYMAGGATPHLLYRIPPPPQKKKKQKWRRNQSTRFFHVLKQHQNCATLWNKMSTNEEVIMTVKLWGCLSTPFTFWLSFWIQFIVFFSAICSKSCLCQEMGWIQMRVQQRLYLTENYLNRWWALPWTVRVDVESTITQMGG